MMALIELREDAFRSDLCSRKGRKNMYGLKT